MPSCGVTGYCIAQTIKCPPLGSLKRRRAATARTWRATAGAQKARASLPEPLTRCLQLAGSLTLTATLALNVPALAALPQLSDSTGVNGVPPLSLDSKPSAPAQGVTPILPQDTTQENLDTLLSEAMSFIKGVRSCPYCCVVVFAPAPCQHDW